MNKNKNEMSLIFLFSLDFAEFPLRVVLNIVGKMQRNTRRLRKNQITFGRLLT